jgi:hypothetical protein
VDGFNEQPRWTIQPTRRIHFGGGALLSMESPMTHAPTKTRAFRVHARHVNAHDARTLVEPSFEAAAVAYVEDLHVLPGGGEEVSVIVQDVETGHEHCFRIDLGSGETSPCA